jgi:NAD+ diphosphatase
MEFPRIAPAIIVLVSNGAGQIVLAHNKKFNTGIFSLIAGFNEAGETLEETVVREVREEVALDVRDVRYVSSQPWPFPHSLMIGFTAQYAGGSLQADGVEIEEARWFDRKHLAAPDMLPGRASVARQLIERWIAGQLP